MSHDVTAERVHTIAASARVPLDMKSAKRVADAVYPTFARIGAEKINLPLEVEPATFSVIAQEALDQ